jgi:catechol 2,3-dioxygenase-like lactoylglutathione lyase family enzyme
VETPHRPTHSGETATDPMIETYGLTHVALAVRDLERSVGRVKKTGDFVPGEPYVFAADPDGHEIEIWYELRRR